jgi:hypothetical protein
MIVKKGFIIFASICCFLTVVTTLGIHLFFPEPPADFEQRVLLFQDKTYIMNRWWIIVHCLLVVISMWGCAMLLIKKSPGFSVLGFLFFSVFAVAEITRQMFVLFYVNELRQQYSVLTDPVIKEGLKFTITNAGLLTAPLFGVFILMFGLGNLFYGLSLVGQPGLDRLLSLMFLVWSIGCFLTLGNSFWKQPSVDLFLEKYSYTYQPLMRAIIGLWLWKKSVELQHHK